MRNSRILLAFFLFLPAFSFGQYQFSNLNLLGHWTNPVIDSITDFGNQRYSGCYGWTDTIKNRRYALVGGTDGTYFIDITQPASPVLCDFVPGALDSSTWREYKTFGHYGYLASDDYELNRFQIVDLSYLPDSVHLVFDNDTLIRRAHTLYIDQDKLYCGGVTYIDTTSPMAVYSLANPESPVLLRRLEEDYPWIDYVHDMFVRNDTVYASAGFQGLFIFRLQGDSQFVMIGQYTLYPDQGFNHSSYLTEDGRYLVFTDEVPEGLDFKVIDVSDLSNISLVTLANTSPGATPHNPYIRRGVLYMAAYQDGLHVYDLQAGGVPDQLGYFDTYWQNDAGGFLDPQYAGCWGAWPFPDNDWVIALDMQNGLFILDAAQALQHAREKNDISGISLYPNPGRNLTIRLDQGGAEKLEILYPDGRVLQTVHTDQNAPTIQVGEENFPSDGLFWIHIQTKKRHLTLPYLHLK